MLEFNHISEVMVFPNDEDDAADQIKLDVLSAFLKRYIFTYLEHIEYDWNGKKWGAPSETIPHMQATNFESLREIHIKKMHIN